MFQKGEPYGKEYFKLSGMLFAEYARKFSEQDYVIQILFMKLWWGTWRRRIFETELIDDSERHKGILAYFYKTFETYMPDWKHWLINDVASSPAEKKFNKLVCNRKLMFGYIRLPIGVRKSIARGYRFARKAAKGTIAVLEIFRSRKKGTPGGKIALYAKALKKSKIDDKLLLIIPSLLGNQEARFPFEELARTMQTEHPDHTIRYVTNLKYYRVRTAELKRELPELLEEGTEAYYKALATAKYIVHDGMAPLFFVRRQGQIVVRCDMSAPFIGGGSSSKRRSDGGKFWAQNVYGADMIVAQTEECIRYLERQSIGLPYQGVSIVGDAPIKAAMNRNYSKLRLSLGGKRVIGVAPCWRDEMRFPQWRKKFVRRCDKFLRALTARVDKDDIVLPYFPIWAWERFEGEGNKRPLGDNNYPNCLIKFDKMDVLTYLQMCDCLISDYSPYMHYFSASGKPMAQYDFSLDGAAFDDDEVFSEPEVINRPGSIDELMDFINAVDTSCRQKTLTVIPTEEEPAPIFSALANGIFNCSPRQTADKTKAYDVILLPPYAANKEQVVSLLDGANDDTLFVVWASMHDNLMIECINQHDNVRYTLASANDFPRTFGERLRHIAFTHSGLFKKSEKNYVRRFLDWCLPNIPARSFVDHNHNMGSFVFEGDKR
jgi:hypothetical protein